MFQKTIVINPWGTRLDVWYGLREEVIAKSERLGLTPPSEDSIGKSYLYEADNRLILWVSPNEPLREESILVHELVHCVGHLLFYIGLTGSDSNEVMAYQMDYLYETIIQFIRKHHSAYEID